jgi:hypothetical protein
VNNFFEKGFEMVRSRSSMKITALFFIILSFSWGHCLASDLPSTATSDQTETVAAVPPGTATSGEETGSCPVSILLEGSDREQEIFARFRDRVLSENERGINYTRLYYIHSPEITLILLTDNDIRVHARKILSDLIPVVSARLKKGEASLSQKTLDDMDGLINEIARSASSELKDVLRMAKSDLIKKTIFEVLKFSIVQ